MIAKRFGEKLRMMLPAVALVALYSLLVNTGAQRQLRMSESRLAVARPQAVTALDVLEQKARCAKLTREIEQLETAKETLVRRATFFCGASETEQAHVAAVENLTQQMARHGLKVTAEATVPANTARLPPSLEAAKQRLAKHGGTDATLVWRIEFTGTYFAVAELLNELARDDSPAVPVNLALSFAESDSSRKGSLVVLVGVAEQWLAEFRSSRRQRIRIVQTPFVTRRDISGID
jgi:hypothetical protein